jgi:hypothetical protein
VKEVPQKLTLPASKELYNPYTYIQFSSFFSPFLTQVRITLEELLDIWSHMNRLNDLHNFGCWRSGTSGER